MKNSTAAIFGGLSLINEINKNNNGTIPDDEPVLTLKVIFEILMVSTVIAILLPLTVLFLTYCIHHKWPSKARQLAHDKWEAGMAPARMRKEVSNFTKSTNKIINNAVETLLKEGDSLPPEMVGPIAEEVFRNEKLGYLFLNNFNNIPQFQGDKQGLYARARKKFINKFIETYNQRATTKSNTSSSSATPLIRENEPSTTYGTVGTSNNRDIEMGELSRPGLTINAG